MTKVVRHPEGKERPPNEPWYTLYPRRALARTAGALGRRRRAFVTNREARRSIVPTRSWRRWRPTFGRAVWAYAYLGTLLLAGWVAAAVYDSVSGQKTWFHRLHDSTWFSTVIGFVGPVLLAAFALTLFLLYWFHRTKKPLVRKARTAPHDLVPTSGTLVDRIVGRRELSQVIAQTLRDRRTRKPYLLVGGVGVGKTAVLVELTRMLAQQDAVPVPIRLRDGDGDGELDFEKLAQRRFAEEADQGVLAKGQIDKTWRQLRLDDKAVVIADGLEEALLDERRRDDRDNIIRRAIDRADRQRLPLVIASRPHAPLEGTRAAIAELEPLSEEAALEYLAKDATALDERRLDWVVETAGVADSPIYLQIARLLRQHGLLDHMSGGDRRGPLDTRSHDRSTLRLWLLDTYREAVEDGRLLDTLVMDRKERQDTFWVVSALACLGLLQDSLDVTFDDFIATRGHAGREPSGPPAAGPAADPPADPAARTAGPAADPGAGPAADPSAARDRRTVVWRALRARFDASAHWLQPAAYPDECRTAFARFAANAQLLGLVKGHENRVRFPHSIIQAYLGHRLLAEMTDEELSAAVEPSLRLPGPGRELLIAIVLLSRRRAATGRPAPLLPPRGAENGPPRRLGTVLCEAARERQDAKFFDLYAAALEIDSVDPEQDLTGIAAELSRGWPEMRPGGDQRSVEEAKLRLVGRFGAALREVDRRRAARARAEGRTPDPAASLLPYDTLFDIGTHEPSHPVRVAIVEQVGAGGDAATEALRRHFPIGDDPVAAYLAQVRKHKARFDKAYGDWLADRPAPGDGDAAGERERRLRDFTRRYETERAESWRYFVMRAWLIPMFVGSVSEPYRDRAKERLDLWLQHLAPASGHGKAFLSPVGSSEPDLPLSLENALAQGFKNAANRRRRHPDSRDETRAYLVRQAEWMLSCSRYWHAQLSLLQALCLWQLPDTLGRADRPPDTDRPHHRDRHDRPHHRDRRHRSPAGPPAGAALTDDPVRSVARWLSMAGSAHDPPQPDGPRRRRTRDTQMLHPFVAEAGDLVTLALETGHPERFLWIDENGAIENVGSTPADPDRYRKHNLWIAPSVGWSVLHPRAQRLIADVLVMLNLTERNGSPDETEERLVRANTHSLPPCVTHDRSPLHPERSVGRADEDEPGATCLATCRFRLCPYPPKAGKAQTEIEEPFCRQQQSLLHSRFRWRPPAVSRHTAPWVSIPVRDLHAFWEEMANRQRTASGDEPPVF